MVTLKKIFDKNIKLYMNLQIILLIQLIYQAGSGVLIYFILTRFLRHMGSLERKNPVDYLLFIEDIAYLNYYAGSLHVQNFRAGKILRYLNSLDGHFRRIGSLKLTGLRKLVNELF